MLKKFDGFMIATMLYPVLKNFNEPGWNRVSRIPSQLLRQ